MLEKTYQPAAIEARVAADWEKAAAFKAGRPDRQDAESYSIVIPPPNVTGSLHMGHALNNTLQDVLCRFERMRGKDVLWQPGTDHAGIATQLVVERQLMERQIHRRTLGREKFVEEVWKWKATSGGTIVNQLKRLGASCDWSRERFTMDEGLSKAVLKVFVDLYRQGLIYKDKRLVNWDPEFQSAVSDLEVDSIEVKGHLWHIRYPLKDDPSRSIIVATTRPETMLGDTAVAVHPDDERYRELVGKMVVLPLVGREIPIVADEYSDPEKGSGAVKITPAHDFNDFEVGRRHNLPLINIFDAQARVNENAPEAYRGLDRFEARKRVVADLEAQGFLDKIEPHVHAVPHAQRGGAVIEPWLTEQWYVDAKTLAKPAIEAVERGDTRFVPKNWEKTYFEWMRNIQPWCISRQLWWGHQIPAWYGPDGQVFVAYSEEEAYVQARAHYTSSPPPGGEGLELAPDLIRGVGGTPKASVLQSPPPGLPHKGGGEAERAESAVPSPPPGGERGAPKASVLQSPPPDLPHRGAGEAERAETAVPSPPPGGEGLGVGGIPKAGVLQSPPPGLPHRGAGENKSLSQKREEGVKSEAGIVLTRDPDVLDTWFSSGLWAFSTLGWPEDTPELRRYYPTSTLVTGFDIIFFWVARMMMLSLHFMKEVPFRDVYIHALVRDEKGQKMSKTKGNVMDPLVSIEEYGADALRFTLARMAAQGRDIKLASSAIEGNRNFATKLWNAARFAEMNAAVRVEGFDPASAKQTVNRWIAGETERTARAVTAALEAFKFNEAANAVYEFTWGVVCDWYLELIKPVLTGSDEAAKAETRAMTAWVLDQVLKLLHPFMPFITEELWAHQGAQAGGQAGLLALSAWPRLTGLADAAADEEMGWVVRLVSEIRSVRSEMNVPAGAKVPLVLVGADKVIRERADRHAETISRLARLESIAFARAAPKGSAVIVFGNTNAALPLAGIIDMAVERARLAKEIDKAAADIAKIDAKLSNAQFIAKAPEEVVEEQRERKDALQAVTRRLTAALKRIEV